MKRPLYSIWINGKPMNFRNRSKSIKAAYKAKIQTETKKCITTPWGSKRLDIEVWFSADCAIRPDVDNVTKPILDALEGIAYVNDSQVRSIKTGYLPRNDAIKVAAEDEEDFLRLLSNKKEEFLVRIFYGMSISGEKIGTTVYPIKFFTKNISKFGRIKNFHTQK